MEDSSVCRICLSTETAKDICDLKSDQRDTSYSEIMLFCLNIQVEDDSKVKKLCIKCYRKILSFYHFKLLALKNDEYFKNSQSNLHVKSEVFVDDDLKTEELTLSDSDSGEIPVCEDIKLEPIKDESQEDCQSDDELLSAIKKIKYEFIPIDNETKENAPVNSKKGKRDKSKSITYVCEECGRSVKDLKSHMQLHEPKESRVRVPCTMCDKTFSSKNSRYKHHQNKHRAVKKSCPICNKLVFNLNQHILCAHNKSKLRYECVPCGRRFLSASARDAHSTVHTKERPHPCDQCDKRFSNKMSLRMHTRQVHDKEKTHLCQFCSKSFFKKYHLQVHLRSHTKEKPYQCKECGKAFGSSSILNNHVVTHSGEKKFRCTLCDMSFVRSAYLHAHMLTHTREKRYACNYCGVKFHRSDHRKRHEFTAHEKHLAST